MVDWYIMGLLVCGNIFSSWIARISCKCYIHFLCLCNRTKPPVYFACSTRNTEYYLAAHCTPYSRASSLCFYMLRKSTKPFVSKNWTRHGQKLSKFFMRWCNCTPIPPIIRSSRAAWKTWPVRSMQVCLVQNFIFLCSFIIIQQWREGCEFPNQANNYICDDGNNNHLHHNYHTNNNNNPGCKFDGNVMTALVHYSWMLLDGGGSVEEMVEETIKRAASSLIGPNSPPATSTTVIITTSIHITHTNSAPIILDLCLLHL